MQNLPKIALGAWAWGNDGTFGGTLTAETLRPIFDKAMENGLNLWDTAYAYGMGTSEKMLAEFVKDLPRDSYLISDKFTPQCADAASPTAMQDMIEMQRRLMSLDRFDLYWIHNVWDAPTGRDCDADQNSCQTDRGCRADRAASAAHGLSGHGGHAA